MNKLTWEELNISEKNQVIETYMDGEDPDEIHDEIIESLKKGFDYVVKPSDVAEWFDKQDAEFQHEIINEAL